MSERLGQMKAYPRVIVLAGLMVMLPLLSLIPALPAPPQEPLNVSRRVLSFYYNWYGYPAFNTTEIHPTLGYDKFHGYNSNDTNIMYQHLLLAQQAGINSFISTWWGRNTTMDRNFRTMLNITLNHSIPMQHTVYFEAVQPRYEEANPYASVNLYTDLKYILDQYGDHPHFLKVGDRPVIFIFNYRGSASFLNWHQAITRLHREGYNPYLVTDIGSSHRGYLSQPNVWKVPINEWDLELFEGFHIYNTVSTYLAIPELAADRVTRLVEFCDQYQKLGCATVFPGYNDTYWWGLRHQPGSPIYPRNAGQTYRKMWDDALATGADWILITTFNEYYEGTVIEPTVEYGDLYMNITAEYTARFFQN